jgi:two-component system nitrogen regulation sensor histidine kinase NtrY
MANGPTMNSSSLPPRKTKKGWRRIIPIFIPLLLLIILLTAESIISKSPQLRTTSDWYNAMFGLVIININIILILVLLIVIFRHLVKLFADRRRRLLGSRFRTKLVLTMLAVIILPTALVYMISSDLISKGIERWYESSVEEIVRSSRQLSNMYLEDYTELLTTQNEYLANLIRDEKYLSEDKVYYLRQQILEPMMAQIHFDVVEVYMGDQLFGETIVNPDSPLLQYLDRPEPVQLNRVLNASSDDEGAWPEVWREHHPTGTIIYSLSPIYAHPTREDPDRVEGAVLLGISINRDLQVVASDISAYYQRYREQIDNRQVVKTASQGLLLIFTLISVFSAIWVGIYFSRSITGPIQQLAEGTRAVAGGDLDYQVEHSVDDELGILISSFNEMTRDLKQSKAEIEAVNRSLVTTNQELERRRRYIETLLANLSTAVISLDDNGAITTENAAVLELLDLPWDSQVGMHWRKAFSEKYLAPLRDIVEQYYENERHYFTSQITLRLPSGVRYLSATITSIRREDGDERGTLIVLENLTELARAQRTAAWQEVAQRIAHEIKNPLTPIQLSAERIRRKVVLPASEGGSGGNVGKPENGDIPHMDLISTATETIIEETGTLKSMVDAFSSFARMPQVELLPNDVNAILEKALSIYMTDPEGNGFTIHRQLEERLPSVDLDQNQLKMAFVNIINNAIDAMDGKGNISITSKYCADRNTVQIQFSDEGPGIAPETKEKLFMPYFSTKKKGTGLGLAIVSRIVSEHHGTISVSDNVPRGTCFTIELPAL